MKQSLVHTLITKFNKTGNLDNSMQKYGHKSKTSHHTDQLICRYAQRSPRNGRKAVRK